MHSDLLFDKELISKLDVSQISSKFNSEISLPCFQKNLIVRPLSSKDYDTGFLDVLGELTTVGSVSQQAFLDRYNAMKNCPSTYYIVVLEDLDKHLVVGTGTLVMEQKFIHGCSVRGRIEDIVVSGEYRGRELGKLLILVLSLLAENLKCYKLTLECKDNMLPFYENLGFRREPNNSNYLQKRFE